MSLAGQQQRDSPPVSITGLPGKQVRLPRLPPKKPASSSSSSSSLHSRADANPRRLPAISVDTDVSRHKALKPPKQLFPPPQNDGARKSLKKNAPQPLNLTAALYSFQGLSLLDLPATRNDAATAAATKQASSTAPHKTPKTPTIVVTPSAESLRPSPRDALASAQRKTRAASSLYSRAFSKFMSPQFKPKTISDASFQCRGIDDFPTDLVIPRRRSLSESTLHGLDRLLSPRSCTSTKEPLTAGSLQTRYYRTSLDTVRRSEGWWDYIKSPFALKRSDTLTSINETRVLDSYSAETTPLLSSAAVPSRSRALAQDSRHSLGLTPLMEEGKERRVLMFGEAAKYYDPDYDLNTPQQMKSASIDHITDGELRSISQRAMVEAQPPEEDYASQKALIEESTPRPDYFSSPSARSDPSTDIEDSPDDEAVKSAVEPFHAQRIQPAAARHVDPRSPSPTSTVFSPEVGIAKLARVRSARSVGNPPVKLADAKTPRLEPPPSFIERHKHSFATESARSTQSSAPSEPKKGEHDRADAFYHLTGNHPTPRANAALIRREDATQQPPLPPLPIIEEGLNGEKEFGYDVKERELVDEPLTAPAPAQQSRWQREDLAHDEKRAVPSGGDSKAVKPSMVSRLKHWLDGHHSQSPEPFTAAGRKIPWLFTIVAAGLAAFVLLIILLCLFLVRKPADMPVQAQWLNLTGYPPLPTGIMTVANTQNTRKEQSCVSPPSLWSCALPQGSAAVADGAADGATPNFLLEIRFRNGSVKQSNMTERVLHSRAAYAHRKRDVFSSMVFAADPSPPGNADRLFLGNTTDNVTAPNLAGEATPFFLTVLLPSEQSSPALAQAQSISSSSDSNDGNGDGSTASVSTASGSSTIDITLPNPSLLPNGSASPGALYPLPAAQPLLLYNRGTADEHFGFYTYFSRTLLLALPSNASAFVSTATAASTNSSSPTDDAEVAAALRPNAQCTFSQTRFHVQMWTRRPPVSSLPSPSSSTALNGTTAADASTSNGGTASAYDYDGPGSLPYQVTVTLDRHGGDPEAKGAYCYGLDAEGSVDTQQKVVLSEDRGNGGSLVSGAAGPFQPRMKGQVAVDGGTGGCACAWGTG